MLMVFVRTLNFDISQFVFLIFFNYCLSMSLLLFFLTYKCLSESAWWKKARPFSLISSDILLKCPPSALVSVIKFLFFVKLFFYTLIICYEFYKQYTYMILSHRGRLRKKLLRLKKMMFFHLI